MHVTNYSGKRMLTDAAAMFTGNNATCNLRTVHCYCTLGTQLLAADRQLMNNDMYHYDKLTITATRV